MEPVLLHRMNDLIMSRHISPQLFVSHLQDSANVYMSKVEKIRQAGRKCVEYRDRIRELERENSLLRVKNSDLVHQLQGMYDESRLALEQKWNMELRNEISNIRLENRGLELLNNDLESQLERIRSRLRDLNLETCDDPEDDAGEIR